MKQHRAYRVPFTSLNKLVLAGIAVKQMTRKRDGHRNTHYERGARGTQDSVDCTHRDGALYDILREAGAGARWKEI